MDHHIKEYFKESSAKESSVGAYHQVIHLRQDSSMSWQEAVKLSPSLPRGWFELSKLKTEDRIEFCRDFWISRFPFHPDLAPLLTKFFSTLDDLCVFLTQKTFDSPVKPKLIYSIKGDTGFFQGDPPADDYLLSLLQSEFPGVLFPQDYLAFLSIHNGFGKLDDTGILQVQDLKNTYLAFTERLEEQDTIFLEEGVPLNPKHLYPFYESFGTRCYQCFLEDWYPEQEMGNAYYSDMTKSLSPLKSNFAAAEIQAFPTFGDWLFFYLERTA